MNLSAKAKLKFDKGICKLHVYGEFEYSREDDEIVMKKSQTVSVNSAVLFLDISINKGISEVGSTPRSFEIVFDDRDYSNYNSIAFFRLGYPYQIEIDQAELEKEENLSLEV